jgi:hypothetical protein
VSTQSSPNSATSITIRPATIATIAQPSPTFWLSVIPPDASYDRRRMPAPLAVFLLLLAIALAVELVVLNDYIRIL